MHPSDIYISGHSFFVILTIFAVPEMIAIKILYNHNCYEEDILRNIHQHWI